MKKNYHYLIQMYLDNELDEKGQQTLMEEINTNSELYELYIIYVDLYRFIEMYISLNSKKNNRSNLNGEKTPLYIEEDEATKNFRKRLKEVYEQYKEDLKYNKMIQASDETGNDFQIYKLVEEERQNLKTEHKEIYDYVQRITGNYDNNLKNNEFDNEFDNDTDMEAFIESDIVCDNEIDDRTDVKLKIGFNNKMEKMIRILILAVATFIILVGLSVVFLLSDSKVYSNRELYSLYYNPTDISILLKRGDASTLSTIVNNAVNAYKSGEYKNAIIQFDAALAIDESMSEIYLFKGFSFIGVDNTDEAIRNFILLSEKCSSCSYEANWYLAIVYLKADNSEKALEHLNKITEDESIYEKDAFRLIEQLSHGDK